MEQQMQQFRVKALRIVSRSEVPILLPPIGNRARHALRQLFDARFAFRAAHRAIEILLRHDIRGGLRPKRRDFDLGLFENQFIVTIHNPRRAFFPNEFIERVNARHGKIARQRQAAAFCLLRRLPHELSF